MIAPHDGEIVGHLVRVVEEERLRVRAGIEGKSSRDVHRHEAGQIAVHVDPDVPRREERGLIVVHLHFVDGNPHRVDDGRAEHGRFPDRHRVDHVVGARDVGLEHVVRTALVARLHRDLGGEVPAEERVLGADLVIEPDQGLVLIAVGLHVEGDLTAWIGGAGEPGHQIQSGAAELRGIDPVVHERGQQRHLTAAVALRRGEGSEIAGQHRRRGHERDVRRGPLADRGALVGPEEEEPVPDDRTADRPAELVSLEAVVHTLAVRPHSGEGARRIESMVAEELEGVSREPVRACLRHGVDRRARVDAVLCGEAARCDAELLQRIREGQREIRVLLLVVVVRAVERVADARLEPASHRDVHTPRHAAAAHHRRLHRRA